MNEKGKEKAIVKNVLDYLRKRDFVEQVTSEDLRSVLDSPASLYLGIDPTASCLHIGHLVGIVLLMHFQRFGHRPVVLIGGATGLIGDPSGKDKERPLLAREEVEDNVIRLTSLIRGFLDTDDKDVAPIFVNNHDWYSSMNVITYLRDLGKQFRMGPMLGKDSVRTRLSSEEGMSYTEFSYQLLQGYDFFYLKEKFGVLLQIGGTDQYGNITAGTEYIRKVEGDAAYGLTFPLLTRSDGKKFGKTEKGAIWLSREYCSPFELYQYLYRIPDSDVIKMMKLLTFLPIEEIHEIEREMQKSSYEANSAQKLFAGEVTELVHGKEGLAEAIEATQVMTPGKMQIDEENLDRIVDNMPHKDASYERVIGRNYVDILVETGLVQSKSDARRLIQNQGAYLNGEKVLDPLFRLEEEHVLKGGFIILSAGKKNALLLRLT